MMVEVGVLEAKTRLSQLLDAALRGDEVVITRHGKPLVRLAPISQEPEIDGAAHVRALREQFAREIGGPAKVDLDADIAEMRGRD